MTATAPTTYLLTADELFGIPDDGKRREIIEGVLYVALPHLASTRRSSFD